MQKLILLSFPLNFSPHSNQTQIIENVGDVMFDAIKFYKEKSLDLVDLNNFRVTSRKYIICTIHRQENTDDMLKLRNIVTALREISKTMQVILPMHPRTASKIKDLGLHVGDMMILEPLPYLEMQRLIMDAACIITDSGGLQKEAYFHRVPCVTLRNETEWIETTDAKWNTLVGDNIHRIIEASISPVMPDEQDTQIYGLGSAASKILKKIGN